MNGICVILCTEGDIANFLIWRELLQIAQ
jgi:hypothetical protein